MRFSQTLIPTLREAPQDAEVISHQLMLRAGMVRKVAAGIYSYLPLALKTFQKISQIVREEMNRSGAQEVLLPIVMPAELWKESGRWDYYGKELLRIKDRHDREFCLGPTHEEAITDLVRQTVQSYKQLPVNLYQIQTKFRDEIRPRFGLMRGREFIMKDSYSFHVDEADALKTYKIMYDTYKRIFTRCGVNFRPVEADTGAIGGNYSHEFQVLAQSGEDLILSCNQCEYAANVEKAETRNAPQEFGKALKGDPCARCDNGVLEEYRGIEVGQVFYLGTKYSKAMQANYLDEKGTSVPMVMGCYGIGVSRTAAASIEQNHDANGIIWPYPIAPFQWQIIALQPNDPAIAALAEKFYQSLIKESIDVLFDDRDLSPGVKFKDADLLGIPYRLVVGSKGLAEGIVEMKNRKTGEMTKIPVDHAIDQVIKIHQTLQGQ